MALRCAAPDRNVVVLATLASVAVTDVAAKRNAALRAMRKGAKSWRSLGNEADASDELMRHGGDTAPCTPQATGAALGQLVCDVHVEVLDCTHPFGPSGASGHSR